MESMNSPLFQEALLGIAGGKSIQTIREDLMRQGLSREAAAYVADQARRVKKAAFRREGLKAFFAGIGMLILGGAVTAASYSMAGPGGMYLITTGLFVVGGVNVFRGLFRSIVG